MPSSADAVEGAKRRKRRRKRYRQESIRRPRRKEEEGRKKQPLVSASVPIGKRFLSKKQERGTEGRRLGVRGRFHAEARRRRGMWRSLRPWSLSEVQGGVPRLRTEEGSPSPPKKRQAGKARSEFFCNEAQILVQSRTLCEASRPWACLVGLVERFFFKRKGERTMQKVRFPLWAAGLVWMAWMVACGGSALDAVAVPADKKLGDLSDAETKLITEAVSKEFEVYKATVCNLAGGLAYTFGKAFGGEEAGKKACSESADKCKTGSTSTQSESAIKDEKCKEATVGELLACLKEQRTNFAEVSKDFASFSCETPDESKIATAITKSKNGTACKALGEKCPSYKQE